MSSPYAWLENREIEYPSEQFGLDRKQWLIRIGVAAVIVGVVGAWFVSGVRSAQEAARRSQCVCNFCQIGLALHNYHAEWNSFPPRHTDDANGKPMHSWRVLLLPYMEQANLYNTYRMDEPWDGPNNRKLLDKMPSIFRCPSRDHKGRTNPPLTSYVAMTGPGTIFPDGKTVTKADVKDGLAQTIIAVEVSNVDILWTEPRDLDVRTMSLQINGKGAPSISSPHPGGAHVEVAEAHAKFLPDSLTVEQVRALTTIAGGEPVDIDALVLKPN